MSVKIETDEVITTTITPYGNYNGRNVKLFHRVEIIRDTKKQILTIKIYQGSLNGTDDVIERVIPVIFPQK